MSLFSGQFGTFGGGYLTGPQGAQAGADYASFGVGWGGGFIQNPMAQAPMVREVPVAAGAVVYALMTPPSKPRQPGRQAPAYHPERAWDSSWPFQFPVTPHEEDWPFELPVSPMPPVTGIQRYKRYR